MNPNKDVLEFEARKKLYDLISKNPGLHLREIDRKTKTPLSTLRYHLDYLKKRGLINIIQEGGFSRYYVSNKIGVLDQKLIHIFRQDILCKIFIKFLLSDKQILLKKDIKLLPNPKIWHEPSKKKLYILKHRTTLNFHLKKLIELDLIEKFMIKGKSAYRLKHYEEIWAFLIKYNNALSNKKIKNMLSWTNKKMQSNMDPFISGFYEIFPHPYHN